MDYYEYSADSTVIGYLNLKKNFDSISAVLLKKLNQFDGDGFDPTNGFAFGFSFGAQLVINAGRDFGGKLSAVDGKINWPFKCRQNIAAMFIYIGIG